MEVQYTVHSSKVHPFPVLLRKAESAGFFYRDVLLRYAEATYQQILALILIKMEPWVTASTKICLVFL